MNAMRRWPSARRCASACAAARPWSTTMFVTPSTWPCPDTATTGTGSGAPIGVSTTIRPSTDRSSMSSRILVDEISAMPVAGDEVQVACLQQRVLDPAHHQRRIPLADLRHHHADGQRAAVPQRLRDRVRPVAGRRGGGADPLLRGRRDGPRRRRAVQHERHRRRREAQLIREHAQRDACGRSRICGRASTTGSHACSCRVALGTRRPGTGNALACSSETHASAPRAAASTAAG